MRKESGTKRGLSNDLMIEDRVTKTNYLNVRFHCRKGRVISVFGAGSRRVNELFTRNERRYGVRQAKAKVSCQNRFWLTAVRGPRVWGLNADMKLQLVAQAEDECSERRQSRGIRISCLGWKVRRRKEI